MGPLSLAADVARHNRTQRIRAGVYGFFAAVLWLASCGIIALLIVSYPSGLPAGLISDAVVGSFDAVPTALAACGLPADGCDFDGRDVLPVLNGASAPARDLYWELAGQMAIRRDRWKLVLSGQKAENEPPAEPVFLADMVTDPSERVNLASRHPALTQELRRSACTWLDGIERRWTTQFNAGQDHGVTAGH